MGLKVRQIEKLKSTFRFAAVRFSVYVKIDVEFEKTVFTIFTVFFLNYDIFHGICTVNNCEFIN